MNLDFKNILNHGAHLDDFELRWRFVNAHYDKFSDKNIELLQPLDKDATDFLNDCLVQSNLHNDFPFSKSYFQKVEEKQISVGNREEVKKWLFNRGFSLDKKVFLLWDSNNALVTTWEILVSHFDSFYYPSSDDLTVFDESLNWALLFFHEDMIYFGVKNEFQPD